MFNLSSGGLDPKMIPRTDILTYNPDNEGWTKTSDMMVGRYYHDFTEVAWKDYSQFCYPKTGDPTTTTKTTTTTATTTTTTTTITTTETG